MLKHKSTLTEQLSRDGMMWLLLAQIAVILPHAGSVLPWALPPIIFSIVWRILTLMGHVGRPGAWLKRIVFALALFLFVSSGSLAINLPSMVSLLLLSFAFKSIETETRRDAIVVIWVAFFLIAASFLFGQEILAALLGIVSMVCVTTALIAVQNPGTQSSILARLKGSSGMLLACLPLMVFVFIVAPRMPPLWSVPSLNSTNQVGVSDSMTPGDIANLSQSDNLAFRAAFTGPRPAQTELYWRGMAMNQFDGKTWQSFSQKLPDQQLRQLLSERLPQGEYIHQGNKGFWEYELLMEPSQQPWLFTLSPVADIEPAATLGFDYRAMADEKITSPRIFNVRSAAQSIRDRELDKSIRALSLQIPEGSNPRTLSLAQQIRVESNSAEAYIETVLRRYTQEPFSYTLQPPTLGDVDTIDGFLFNSQRGFCAHYAGSFVFMMRAAGIPARVVVGYQGGEWNAQQNYFSVRQYDAHAWAEVWLPNKGWIRHDPTARVAPNRVERNLRDALSEDERSLLGSAFSVGNIAWLDGVRKGWDATQYRWRKFVINYDSESQLALLTELLGEFTATRLAIAAAVFFSLIGFVWAFALGMIRWPTAMAPEAKLFMQFEQLLAKKGFVREPSFTPTAYAQNAAQRWPLLQVELQTFVGHYNTLCYTEGAGNETCLRKMRDSLSELRSARFD